MMPVTLQKYQELAKKLEVKEEAVAEELKKVKPPTTFQDEELDQIELTKSGGGQKSRRELLEERLVSLVLKSPENLDFIGKDDFELFSPSISPILDCLRKKTPLDKLNPELANLINYLSLRAEIEEEEEINPQAEFKNCLKELRCLEIKNKLDKISKNVKLAEEEKKSEELEKLIREFNSCSKTLGDLDNIP